jgi:hypothetical protein
MGTWVVKGDSWAHAHVQATHHSDMAAGKCEGDGKSRLHGAIQHAGTLILPIHSAEDTQTQPLVGLLIRRPMLTHSEAQERLRARGRGGGGFQGLGF